MVSCLSIPLYGFRMSEQRIRKECLKLSIPLYGFDNSYKSTWHLWEDLSIPLYGFCCRYCRRLVNLPRYFQFHCMDSRGRVGWTEINGTHLSIPLYGFLGLFLVSMTSKCQWWFFQFHCMDSSVLLAFRWAVFRFSFNSIVWIHCGLGCQLGAEVAFQFHCMDSMVCTTVYDIPTVPLFQFHCMDSMVYRVMLILIRHVSFNSIVWIQLLLEPP